MELSAMRLEASQLAPEPKKQDAAHDLEKVFATFIVKELGRALPNGFFGKGAGADIYEGWLQEHMGQALADSGAMDLAGSIKASIDSKDRMANGAARAEAGYGQLDSSQAAVTAGLPNISELAALRPLRHETE